jgi:hypothetical protein
MEIFFIFPGQKNDVFSVHNNTLFFSERQISGRIQVPVPLPETTGGSDWRLHFKLKPEVQL